MGGWRIKLDAETKLFNKNVSDLVVMGRKSVDDILKDCAITFLQSAAKATPESKAKTRTVVNSWERDRNFMIAARWPFASFRRGACMYINRIGVNKRRFFTERNREDIPRFNKITFRGIHSFGWSGNLFKLGKSPRIKNNNLMELLSRVTHTVIKKANWLGQGAEITTSNKVKLIGDWADYTRKEGLFKANIRLKWQLENLKSKFKKAWK